MQPVLEEHSENNLDPESDLAAAANIFIEDQRSDSGSDAGDNDEGAADPISKIIGVRTHTMMSMIHRPSKMLRRTMTSTKRFQ
jgi:hypothetical protein